MKLSRADEIEISVVIERNETKLLFKAVHAAVVEHRTAEAPAG